MWSWFLGVGVVKRMTAVSVLATAKKQYYYYHYW